MKEVDGQICASESKGKQASRQVDKQTALQMFVDE
jgi:hypothetical protein